MNLQNLIVIETIQKSQVFIDPADILFLERDCEETTIYFKNSSLFRQTEYTPEEIIKLIKLSREEYAQRKANETMDLISGFSKVFSMLGSMLVPEEKPQRDKEV